MNKGSSVFLKGLGVVLVLLVVYLMNFSTSDELNFVGYTIFSILAVVSAFIKIRNFITKAKEVREQPTVNNVNKSIFRM